MESQVTQIMVTLLHPSLTVPWDPWQLSLHNISFLVPCTHCPSQERATPTELHGLGKGTEVQSVLDVPSAAVPSQGLMEAQGSGGSLNPQ